MTICETFRVLIVEDESRYRDLLVREIGEMGYPAHGTAKAEEALALLEQEKFAVLLVDLNLRGMNGMELLASIRQRRLEVGVIVLASSARLEPAVEALRLHADDYLARPCTLGQIERSLAALQRRHAEKMRAVQMEGLAEPLEPEPRWRALPSRRSTNGAGNSTLQDLERAHIYQALAQHHGNKPAAAAQLGISLRTLYNRLKQYSQEALADERLELCERN